MHIFLKPFGISCTFMPRTRWVTLILQLLTLLYKVSHWYKIMTFPYFQPGMRDAPAVRQKLHDSNILIEEYLYYAGIQREQERQGIEPDQRAQIARSESHRITTPELVTKGGLESINDKGTEAAATTTIDSLISDEDWDNATRAFRNASWISM